MKSRVGTSLVLKVPGLQMGLAAGFGVRRQGGVPPDGRTSTLRDSHRSLQQAQRGFDPSTVQLQHRARPWREPSGRSVAVPPTPLPTNDVDVYFETSADDNEHARFQKAKEQLEIRHRNRMDRVGLGPFPGWRQGFLVGAKGRHLRR